MISQGLRQALLIATFGLLAARAGFAAGFLYECDMDDPDRGLGWVSPKIAIVLPGDGSVTVVDALTITFSDAPVSGRILRDNDARLIVKWTLRDVRADTGRSFAHFDYRASISKPTGRIELTAQPRTFDSGLRSVGSCRKRTE
ncbi:hypothetical protein AB2B41_17530 [Marimonas sp. MJW-29]|uniref:Uncharacterized protein n=1 Tax=Sulfitobacter sediminis TaxID=3234186 RepID=A0ABV3RQX3_9RHOB